MQGKRITHNIANVPRPEIEMLAQVQRLLWNSEMQVQEISEKAGISRRAVDLLINGTCKDIRVGTLIKITEVLTGLQPVLHLQDKRSNYVR